MSQGDDVLVPVVRKLDRELKLRSGVAESEASFVAGRRFHVTDGTDWRPRAAEELRAMTAHASVVVRVINYVGESRSFGPVFGWYLVARVAG